MVSFCQFEDSVALELSSHGRILRVAARPDAGLSLRAPDHTGMERFLRQSVHASLTVSYQDEKSGLIVDNRKYGAALKASGQYFE
jgi:hypothetical protein